ncbi:cytosine permease [Leucobacter insecticola]|uniref:Cytosine permease n=1 Tax=Leucobacter insecticola TaxID=2714934 RepID=A0A6G8FK66_9MICO|nr:cytosine permease [Leucobacter insecticola]QIM16744.1 cytosine permease [Leucobacter insecticola]
MTHQPAEDTSTSTLSVEQRTIDMVPKNERHGTPMSQFTLWFGGNMQITAIVTGLITVAIFQAEPLTAIIALIVGNVIGGISMALHSAQGPRMGLPQMISSRVQFGVRGATLPLVLVICMYLGFASTGAALSGDAINHLIDLTTEPGEAPITGILIFGALTAIVSIFGYRLIHVMGRVATIAGILGFAYLFIRIFTAYDVSASFGVGQTGIATFMVCVTLGASWQMTYAPYVADYSRYLPADTPVRKTFWATFLGSVTGTQISMTMGVLIGAVSGNDLLGGPVGFLGVLAGPVYAALVIYLVIIVGKLTANTLNAYGGIMCTVTAITSFNARTRITSRARSLYIIVFVALTMVIAIAASADFLNNFKNFVLLLLAVFIPWSIINLVDYYLVSKERIDIPALYDRRGRYGSVNWVALSSYAIGIVVQIPFLTNETYSVLGDYNGVFSHVLGGMDISWIVSMIVTFCVYYPWAKRTMRPPAEMIYPPEYSAEQTGRINVVPVHEEATI